MARIDRRRFLLGVAAAAGAILAGGARAAGAVRPRAGRRAASYRALVRALRDTPDARFRHADPAAAYRRFAHWYAAQPAASRAHADVVLDRLGTPRADELCDQPRSARRAATLAAAVSLACIGCDPPLTEDERPDVPSLVA